jgi:hypothetical protein
LAILSGEFIRDTIPFGVAGSMTIKISLSIDFSPG